MNALFWFYLIFLVALASIAVAILFNTIECIELHRRLIEQQQTTYDEWAAMVARSANDSPDDDSWDDLSEFWGAQP
jgi:hypothetical protein